MIDLSEYTHMVDGGSLPASKWNACMSSIENAINGVASSGKFLVNGVPTEPENGIVRLEPQGTYVLSGQLNGRVVIGKAEDTPTDDTFVFLDGVDIRTNHSDAYGLFYACEAQSMFVTLVKNKRNIITCSYETEMAEQQGACLYSENNMVVQGNGYLNCVNKGGHGIKASELKFNGRPHIYVEAIHDGIHGNSKLYIADGKFCVNGANDAFGTGSTGSIYIFGGEFHAFNIKQNVFDSKMSGYIFCPLNAYADVAESKMLSGISYATPSVFFGTGVVKNGTTIVEPVDGVYNCTTGTEIFVNGYVQGQILVGTSKVKVILQNAYVECNSGHAIYYNSGSSKVTIKCETGTINFVQSNGDECDAIKSDNNVTLEVKGGSYLVIGSKGVGVNGSTVVFHDSKGTTIIKNCGSYGIQGTEIYFATEPDFETGKVTDPTAQMLYGAVMAYNNLIDIFARLSSKGLKGTILFNRELLYGVVSADKIKAMTTATCENSPNMFFNQSEGALAQCLGKTYEPFDYITNTPMSII